MDMIRRALDSSGLDGPPEEISYHSKVHRKFSSDVSSPSFLGKSNNGALCHMLRSIFDFPHSHKSESFLYVQAQLDQRLLNEREDEI